jgi:hypothetical protein
MRLSGLNDAMLRTSSGPQPTPELRLLRLKAQPFLRCVGQLRGVSGLV